jgi:hypothetical protein
MAGVITNNGMRLQSRTEYLTQPLLTVSPAPHTNCAICFNDLAESEAMQASPECRHVFHKQCLLVWFGTGNGRNTCPFCRRVLFRMPILTMQTTPPRQLPPHRDELSRAIARSRFHFARTEYEAMLTTSKQDSIFRHTMLCIEDRVLPHLLALHKWFPLSSAAWSIYLRELFINHYSDRMTDSQWFALCGERRDFYNYSDLGDEEITYIQRTPLCRSWTLQARNMDTVVRSDLVWAVLTC